MGKLIRIKTADIIPSQDFIKDGTIRYIKDCINKGREDELPPTPIIRKHPKTSKYIAIDGHNLLVAYDSLDKELEMYVAESKDDGLTGSSDAIMKRNQDLKEKFDQVLESIKNIDVKTIGELRKKYRIKI